MHKQDNICINYTAGDTFKRTITPEMPEDGSKLRFQVAAIEGGEAFINHTYSLNSDNEYDVVLSDSDTAKLLAGNDYVYRATQISITGEIITKISGHFIVTWGVNADSDKDISIGMTPENKLKAMINSESEQRKKNDIELRDMIREKVDKTGISNLVDKSLFYYGDSTIIPTDESYFNITEDGAISRNLNVWDDNIVKDVVIPYEVNGIKVTKIAEKGFGKPDDASPLVLTTVIMPNSITSIGFSAFSYCPIENIVIPDGVTLIDSDAFFCCGNLSNVTIPNSVKTIKLAAFQYTVLDNVIFKGSKSQWDAIDVVPDGNEVLLNANIIFEGNLATEEYVNTKADKATTLAEYGIGDAYTKNEVDEKYNYRIIKIEKPEDWAQLDTLDNFYGFIEADVAVINGMFMNYIPNNLDLKDMPSGAGIDVWDRVFVYTAYDKGMQGAYQHFHYNDMVCGRMIFVRSDGSISFTGSYVRAISHSIPEEPRRYCCPTETAVVEYVESKAYPKTTISTSSDTAYIFDLLDNCNKEIRLTAVLSSISFNIPTKPKDDYISSLSFSTGDVTIPIDYPSGGIINWVGTDCSISDGISNFIPSPNKHYDIVFYYNGTSIVGMVNGFVPAEVSV